MTSFDIHISKFGEVNKDELIRQWQMIGNHNIYCATFNLNYWSVLSTLSFARSFSIPPKQLSVCLSIYLSVYLSIHECR